MLSRCSRFFLVKLFIINADTYGGNFAVTTCSWCLQELLHKDLEQAEYDMQQEFESIMQQGPWGDVASARRAEDEDEDEGEIGQQAMENKGHRSLLQSWLQNLQT
jgi:hypothetical protein